LMFRSVSNLTATVIPTLPRYQHDFLDDLESFFWVYVNIAMMYDGPGPDSVTATPCTYIDSGNGPTLSGLSGMRHYYLSKSLEPEDTALRPSGKRPFSILIIMPNPMRSGLNPGPILVRSCSVYYFLYCFRIAEDWQGYLNF